MESNFEKTNQSEIREIDIREQISKYLRYWPWFIVSLILTISIALLYLRYANPVYSTTATILIKDDANRAVSEVAAFQDIGAFGTLNPTGFENEINILKSYSLTNRVVKNLNLNVSYFTEGNIRTTEIYQEVPFKVVAVTPDSLITEPFTPFFVIPVSEKRFKIWDEEDLNEQEYEFGAVVSLQAGDVQINKKEYNFNRLNGKYNPIKVYIQSVPGTVARYRGSLEIEQMTKLSSVIQLTLNAANRKKSEAILNEFVDQYNEDAINDRNMVARNTADFIKGRLEIISEELDSVETGKVEFKQSRKLTEIEYEGQLTLQEEVTLRKAILEIDVQLELINIIIDHLRNAGEHDLIPTATGIEKDGVSNSIDLYNQIVLERSRLLAGSTEKNPTIVSLTQQIQELKANILAGMNSTRTSMELRKNDLVSQSRIVEAQISSGPSIEKIFRSISRQQELKEALYLYLLQKREENAISMAVTAPKAKVVDYAYSSLMPVSPKKQLILLGAVILGLLIPFLVIYLQILLDNKIRNKFDVEQGVKSAPVVGEIPRIGKKESEIIKANDRSIMAESFRILSTNLEYLFVKNEDHEGKGRVILVTSTIKGEGKTFVSCNLAITLANTGAKVLLVGGDLRNPQIHRYAPERGDGRHKNGVVEFLVHRKTKIEEFIRPSNFNKNMDMLYSGTIPPNPAELLMLDRTDEMFDQLRELYDFVIVDTAPAMLVTDTFLLRDQADSTIYVTRAGYTQKHLLGFADESIRFEKMKNVAFVINNVSAEDLGYGSKYGYYYSYGYGYGPGTKRSFWKRLTRSF